MSDDKPHIEPMSSVQGDLRRMKRNTTVAASELKGFLAELRGRSPQEMLGLVAESSLFRCCITATFVFIALLVAFTAVPYGMAKMKAEQAAERVAGANEPVEAPAKPAAGKPEAETAVKQPGGDATEEPESEPEDGLVDKLGIGDAIVSPLDSNPLENTGDDLFDDLK